MAKNKQQPTLQFYQRLILNRFLFSEFGYDDFNSLSETLKNPDLEKIDSEGHSGFYNQLCVLVHSDTVTKDTLAEWDLHILSHLKRINEKRSIPVSLKYFQYLSLLFTEYYLDQYCNHRMELLEKLNAFVSDFNAEYTDSSIEPYAESDLNKIAFWNATGSGKTLLMHINYLQYIYYSKGRLEEGASYILLTPKEGLTAQHLDDFTVSNIPAAIYDKNASRWLSDEKEIQILENTKLAEKDGDKTVAAARFGSHNIVFVDEGHRGASGDTWYKYRNQLCADGFTFEYSATFGQAVTASGDNELVQEYAKCILFDYSYKYFYRDGYGKEYNIINLKDDAGKKQRLYLTACLLSFYQQKKVYLEHKTQFAPFNIENPLFTFLGHTVIGKANSMDDKQSLSDIIEILLFIKKFVSESKETIHNIDVLLTGSSGFVDALNRDIFANRYSQVTGDAGAVYKDVLSKVFNCETAGTELHVGDLRGIQGEITLWLGDNKDKPFGLINVGDDGALLKLCEQQGFDRQTDTFGKSIFQTITDSKSPVNILIGSKKFSEGWNCWRVSTMGLMNIGKSEGSEIIQLFGRGVRLKGYNMSLKRSREYQKDDRSVKIPSEIVIDETLNVFGVHADYMNTFKQYLEQEGVPTNEQVLVINLPVIRNEAYKTSRKKLYTLRLPEGINYKKDAPKPSLKYTEGLSTIYLDCYSKVQFESSKSIGEEVSKETGYLSESALSILDYDELYFALLNYKNETARFNMNIAKNDIRELLHNTAWYELLIPSKDLEVKAMSDKDRFMNIALTLLKKYFDQLYYSKKKEWETPYMNLSPLEDTDDNFVGEYTVNISQPDDNPDAVQFIETLKEKIEEAKVKKQLLDLSGLRKSGLEAALLDSSLYNPLLYVANNTIAITVSPVALVKSEFDFINSLKSYCLSDEGKKNLKDKELYIIRNKSKKGIGFFENAGFYPDFILWLIDDTNEHMIFVDPHGMSRENITDPKVQLYKTIKTLQPQLSDKSVILDSFIVSPTKHNDLVLNNISVKDWNDNHVYFMEEGNYTEKIFGEVNKDVEYRIVH